ncbi:prophage minor tail protein Z [Clostridium aceticum]|uniref:Prophage minor tail protein Z n=1 Tax=Clostridium aceticum TaxID=84022 RepID=A0A0D8ID71_9CLOT|nr:phage tail protein [Clostridium aceticum]AKL95012.1 prophage minor tail protein Z [Clostridium aceticum]KJF27912.1 hypothetical protein TZ02_04870 [Clostridium aceticum]
MIKIDAKKIKKVEKQLGSFSNKAPTVISWALNRTASNVQANAVRKARAEYNIKAQDVKDTIKITKANKQTLGALVKSSGKGTPLIKFKVTPKQVDPKKPPKVLKAAVKKGGLKKVIGAFVADLRGNKIFRRKKSKRLPIKELFGPAVPQMLNNIDVRVYIEIEALKTFDKRLEREIKRVLEVNQ